MAFLPQSLKRPLYRLFFGFRISSTARIGVALLDCKTLVVGPEARIGHGVGFVGCGEVRVGAKVAIGFGNVFRGGHHLDFGDWSQLLRLNVVNAIPDRRGHPRPGANFKLGFGSVITSEHRIDFTGGVIIGDCAILGGRNSSLWTHNRRSREPIVIGNYCYVGSEIRMAPGTSIADCCVVGLGAVVTESIEEPFSLVGGLPARRIRPLGRRDEEILYGKTRLEIPDEIYPNPPPIPDIEVEG
jgi:acetyltransferase-like isoleucine patch superfamily enzyme